MIEIAFKNVRKNYGFKDVLENINFEIMTNEKVALIGANGCGKSTIFKLIIKEEIPSSGIISVRNKAKIGILNQFINDYDNKKVKDIIKESFKEINILKEKLDKLEKKIANNIDINNTIIKYSKLQEEFIKLGGYEMNSNIDKLVSAFKINNLLDKDYGLLSGGEKTIINLICVLMQKPDILLLDEPTNHLDIKMMSFLENLLKDYNATIFIISHDRYFLNRIVDKTILIEDGKNYVFYGNYDDYIIQNKNRLEKYEKDYKVQEKKICAMEKSAKRLREFAGKTGTGGEIFYKRAKSIEKRISKMDKMKRPVKEDIIPINLSSNIRSGNVVLKITNLCKRFNDKVIFNNLNLNVLYQDRICIFGSNGCGKTTLLKEILNSDKSIYIGSSVKIGYISQIINFNDETISIYEEARKYFIGDESYLRSALNKFLFKKDDIYKRLNKLSGGERVRLKLFCLINNEYNFLIFDEITNYIDISTKEVLESAIKNFNGTVLFISHDRYFIDQVATKIALIKNYNIKVFDGNYTENSLYLDF